MTYTFKLVLVGLLTLILGSVIIVLAPFDRQGKRAYAVGRLWTRAILKLAGIRLNVRGLEHLDSTQAYIFMANHQSYVDIPVLVEAFSQFQIRLIAKKELVWVPVFGWALWASKHIMIDRSGRAQMMASLRSAKEKIAQGISVVIFPEGTRGRDGSLLPFKRGGFVLAVMARVPVVPVTLVNSGDLLPRGHWRLREGEIKVIVDEPISMDPYDLKNLGQLSNRVRTVMLSHLSNRLEPRTGLDKAEERLSEDVRAQG